MKKPKKITQRDTLKSIRKVMPRPSIPFQIKKKYKRTDNKLATIKELH